MSVRKYEEKEIRKIFRVSRCEIYASETRLDYLGNEFLRRYEGFVLKRFEKFEL